MQAGFSQEQLAERAETDITQIGGLERGTRNPSYSTLLRLSMALDTSVGGLASFADELLKRVKDEPPGASSR